MVFKFFSSLSSVGFQQSKTDYSMFTRDEKSGFLTLLIYVDDIIIGSSNMTIVINVYLHFQFKIKDLGNLKYFLDLKIAISTLEIHLC